MATSAIFSRVTSALTPRRQTAEGEAGSACGRRAGRSVREFIENRGTDETKRWMTYIAAGLLIMGAVTFLISSVLDGKSDKVMENEQAVSLPEHPRDSAYKPDARESALRAPKLRVQKMARSLAMEAEAEAAIQPVSLMVSNPGGRLNAPALRAVDSSLLSAGSNGSQHELVSREVSELLARVEVACEKEDKETLVKILDDQDSQFRARYVADAERLFRSFNDITVSFSNVEVSPLTEEETLVNVHVRVEGAFALTGSWMVLSNADKAFTLRKKSASDWKLCSVN